MKLILLSIITLSISLYGFHNLYKQARKEDHLIKRFNKMIIENHEVLRGLYKKFPIFISYKEFCWQLITGKLIIESEDHKEDMKFIKTLTNMRRIDLNKRKKDNRYNVSRKRNALKTA